ncbi:hypothetical protein HJG60_010485 [Phyllostomus discolor]|uniref:Uncharacterized protein n=1 Tax=Phyllostomus discolor TaxID=89673 RepID=A0A834ANV0_9CHIR|nr:hypothetical protein HJG60_010485 [Phyllostomus discolor]
MVAFSQFGKTVSVVIKDADSGVRHPGPNPALPTVCCETRITGGWSSVTGTKLSNAAAVSLGTIAFLWYHLKLLLRIHPKLLQPKKKILQLTLKQPKGKKRWLSTSRKSACRTTHATRSAQRSRRREGREHDSPLGERPCTTFDAAPSAPAAHWPLADSTSPTNRRLKAVPSSGWESAGAKLWVDKRK